MANTSPQKVDVRAAKKLVCMSAMSATMGRSDTTVPNMPSRGKMAVTFTNTEYRLSDRLRMATTCSSSTSRMALETLSGSFRREGTKTIIWSFR